MNDLQDLQIIVDSRLPIVVIETWEENRALDLLRRIGMKSATPVFGWSITSGLRRLEMADAPAQRHTVEPDAALAQIRATTEPGIYALCDFHPFLENAPRNVRLVKEIALNREATPHTLVFVSHALNIPPVFMVATANEIDRLPPELIRKGRLDEIFFVDLPDEKVRTAIFRIHLQKRGIDSSPFNLDRLAEHSDGFTGAEIEQAVVAAVYSADARGEAVSEALLIEELESTVPLSITMSERLHALRQWCHSRAVPAG